MKGRENKWRMQTRGTKLTSSGRLVNWLVVDDLWNVLGHTLYPDHYLMLVD
jgi:hypothetical protein